jgi:hypothetical protein
MSLPAVRTSSFDVFICYNSADRSNVKSLVAELDKRGVRAWWDDRLSVGDDHYSVIENIMGNTPVAVVMLGPNGIGIHQNKEIGVLHNLDAHGKVCIISVLMAGAQLPPGSFLLTRSLVDCKTSGLDEDRISKIEEAIRKPRRSA